MESTVNTTHHQQRVSRLWFYFTLVLLIVIVVQSALLLVNKMASLDINEVGDNEAGVLMIGVIYPLMVGELTGHL